MLSRLSLAPRLPEEDDALKLHDGVSTETREVTIAASQLRPAAKSGPTASPGLDELIGGGTSRRQHRESHAAARNERRNRTQPERQPAKPKRSSVPSWDEIVFGTRNDQ